MHAPDWDEFQALQAAAGGNIGILTLAPELPGAIEFIRRVSASGVIVALSHTDGTRAHIHDAAAAGASLSTHLGNGCPALLHRHHAPFWAQLASDRLDASIICDGFHLPGDHVKIIQRVKGTDRCILVTDAVHVARLPPGRYSFGKGDVLLLPTGQVITADGGSMAGSTLSMDRAVATFMDMSGISLAEALRAATCNPARRLRRASVCRDLIPGEVANLVLFELRGSEIVVHQTIVGGTPVHDAGRQLPDLRSSDQGALPGLNPAA
jgi:N-acetylglucosamine-6-phosphate deacetylase